MSESSAAQTATKTPIDYADHLTISCSVSDLERAIAWYRDLLGFELIYKLDDMGWCELRTAWKGISIGLGQSETTDHRRHDARLRRRGHRRGALPPGVERGPLRRRHAG